MKKEHKLFFAIPFDAATKKQYERVSAKIRRKYPGVTTAIGNNQIGPSPKYSEFATFKAQNRELNEQFVKQIREADIVVADLTHNNPNVHVELGIALMQYKNILRVTGRSVSDIGFDIRNLEVSPYRDEVQLLGIITKYLDMFLEIKKLPFRDDQTPLYSRLAAPTELKAMGQAGATALLELSPGRIVRDGAVRVDFTIRNSVTPADWFGVCFRVGALTPWLGCHMVYVRRDGSIDLATFPGPEVVNMQPPAARGGQRRLTIEFENNFLRVNMKGVKLETDRLSRQEAGRIVLAALKADVDITSGEVICRDTIEWEAGT